MPGSARTNVHLTLAINDYDHVRDLVSVRVAVEGVDLTCLRFAVEEIFHRFTHHREWHVSELSLAKFCSLRAAGDESLVAIPVFPSRTFRHSALYVRADGPARWPAGASACRSGRRPPPSGCAGCSSTPTGSRSRACGGSRAARTSPGARRASASSCHGIEPNRVTLDGFLGYAHEQGVCARRLAPEDLFVEQESFRV